MRNSLEMRVPFLDVELVKFLETLPSHLKMRGTQRKYIHKEAAKRWLPSEIIYRKKRGFATPMDEWLQSDVGSAFGRLIDDKDSACRKFFDVGYIHRMIRMHQEKKENYQRHLFILLSFEIWYRTFFENNPIEKKWLSEVAK
jgi:asparagine synthase (glutamine-hydrolysing)